MEATQLSTARGEFTALTWGNAEDPVALCLHGFPDSPHTFSSLAARLSASGFSVVAPFARGYQPSPPFPRTEDGKQSVFETLGHDVVAIAQRLSNDCPVALVGHDNGAFTAYYAMSEAPDQFSRAVTMTAGHPAAVFSNTMKLPHQMWKSRYAFLFQIPKLSDWYAERNGFQYLRELWDSWAAPGWTVSEEHWQIVREVMERSWPAPLEHYREMAFSGPHTKIPVPTLYLIGSQDGCVEPDAAKGQEHYFSGQFEQRVIDGAGHFLHLEKAEVIEPMVVDWLSARTTGAS